MRGVGRKRRSREKESEVDSCLLSFPETSVDLTDQGWQSPAHSTGGDHWPEPNQCWQATALNLFGCLVKPIPRECFFNILIVSPTFQWDELESKWRLIRLDAASFLWLLRGVTQSQHIWRLIESYECHGFCALHTRVTRRRRLEGIRYLIRLTMGKFSTHRVASTITNKLELKGQWKYWITFYF